MSISTAFNWLWQFLIETIGLSLEEIQLLYEEGIKPWKSASWVPPSRRGAFPGETEANKKSWKEVLKFTKSSN
ncbi:BFH_HP2_G0006120.mRNA.1.CDS.1 [Saccharomyces cerevisiae]|nr:BFH_HP2_G0006120.mRNA.1.CDS.1 [Saccharomyces cerevisiae]CAI6411189.1 BFH_HP2_G0006120.mRNA.1.CDS.1 [Saccharomyces cerevisiae]